MQHIQEGGSCQQIACLRLRNVYMRPQEIPARREPLTPSQLKERMQTFAKCKSLVLLNCSQLMQHSDVKLSKTIFNLTSAIKLRLREKKMASVLKTICSSPLFVLPQLPFRFFSSFFWSCSKFLPVKIRSFKTKTGPCVTYSDVLYLFIKLIMVQRGHMDILPPSC